VSSTPATSSISPIACASSVLGSSPPTSSRSAMRADHASHQPLDAFGRYQAYLRFVEADAERPGRVRRPRHDAIVAAQCQHAAAGGRVSADAGGDRHGRARQCTRDVEEPVPCLLQRGAVLAERHQGGHVEAGREDRRQARQRDALRALVLRLRERVAQFGAESGVERIHRRARHAHFRDAVVVEQFHHAHGDFPNGGPAD